VVLHLGGMTSPLASWADISGSVAALVQSVIDAVATQGQALTVMGSPHLAGLGLGGGPVTVLGDISPERAAQLIAGASVLITTPGIGAIFEALSQDTPVILLPPMNSTQLMHHQVLTGAGLHDLLSPAHAARLTALAGTLDWTQQTQLCLALLRQVGPQLAPPLARRLSDLLANRGMPCAATGCCAPAPGVRGPQPGAAAGRDPQLAAVRGARRTLASPARPTSRRCLHDRPQSRPAPDPKALEATVQAMPKVELHVHLEGSIPPELMLSLARRNGLKLPFDQPGSSASNVPSAASASLPTGCCWPCTACASRRTSTTPWP
jgi:UDP-N-acetylglucosamine transferase subunit ALG13